MSNSRCYQWHLDIGTRLAAHSRYGVIPVVTEFPAVRSLDQTWAQTVQKVTAAVTGGAPGATKSGLCIFVNLAHTEGAPDTLGAIRTQLVTEISVLELPIYNRNPNSGFGALNGIYADDAAEVLAEYMHNWRDNGVADAARVQGILTDHPGWLPSEIRDKLESKPFVITSAFQLRALMSVDLISRPYPPLISIAGGQATITCNTAAATICYTLDGTMPTATSTVYATPVVVTTGQVVRAIASKTGLDASDVAYGVAP